jgi:hypothetical protein
VVVEAFAALQVILELVELVVEETVDLVLFQRDLQNVELLVQLTLAVVVVVEQMD